MRRAFFRPEEFAMNFCKMRLGWGCVCVCQRPFTVTALLVMGALNVPEKNISIFIPYKHVCFKCGLNKFSLSRMDNYLGRVVGEVAHAGKQNPEIDLILFHKKRIFIFFQQRPQIHMMVLHKANQSHLHEFLLIIPIFVFLQVSKFLRF